MALNPRDLIQFIPNIQNSVRKSDVPQKDLQSDSDRNLKSLFFRTVFILFVIRIFFLILVPPYIGIANNGDFQRLSVSVGIDYAYNPWDEGNYDISFWNYVPNDYKFIEPVDTGWIQVFALFPKIAILLSNRFINGRFDIRFLGFVNAAVYCLGVYLLLNNIKRVEGLWSYALLMIAVLCLGDSYVLQYFNSFYTEIGSVSASLILWGLLLLAFDTGTQGHPFLQLLLVAALSIAAIFAVLSKQQDILLAIPFVFIMWIVLKRFDVKTVYRVGWEALFVVTVAVFFIGNTAGGNITTYNVISMDLLANSEDPYEHLQAMGFDDSEAEMFLQGVGQNAFSSGLPWKDYENFFTRTNELKILLREPKIFFRMVGKRATNLFMDDPTLGNYTIDSGAAPHQKTAENKLWSNLKTKIYGVGLGFYLPVVMLALFFGIFGRRIRLLRKIPSDLFYVYLVLPMSNVLRFVTIMLGDSSHDDIKHFFTVNFEFDFMFWINACLLVSIAVILIRDRLNSQNNEKQRK